MEYNYDASTKKDCWYLKICNQDDCDVEKFCIRHYKMSYLINKALLEGKQQYSIPLYPDDIGKIVRFGYGLISNHPFHDGNKRIGALVLLTLLELNGYLINTTDKELSDVIYAVASGSDGKTYEDLLAWVNAHTGVAFS